MPGVVSNIIYPPDESYLTDYDSQYPLFLGLCDFIETIDIKKNTETHNNLKSVIDIPFPLESEIVKVVENTKNSHSTDIAWGAKKISSRFDFPSTSVYKITIGQVTQKAVEKANTKTVTIKPKSIPSDYYATYGAFLVYNENPNSIGRELIKDQDNNIRYDEDDDGNIIYELINGRNEKIQMVRWFPHTSAEGGTDTIGFGHKLTEIEDSSSQIIINGKSYNFRQRGLRSSEVRDLFINDVKIRVEAVQSFVGAERWNWLIDNHPSWACILVDMQYNPGNVRSYPKLMYWMGLYTSPKPPEDGGNTAEWNAWVSKIKNMKTLTGIPFKPVIKEGTDYDEQLRHIDEETRRYLGISPLTKRNASTTQTFIYHFGSHYDNILSNGGKPLTDY
jgi:hypothetical protein